MRLLKLGIGAAVLVAACAALASATRATQAVVGLDAQVVAINPASSLNKYPMVEYGRTTRAGTTEWRVVQATGNCCENYLTITKRGRLLDYGGSYINYTDDRGKTWKSVRPAVPLVNGEGAIVVAQNGDVLGVEWDPYSGDHLQAYKYDAALNKWFYKEMPLHQPFYDREWIGIIPGPLVVAGKTVPYISFVKGAWPSKELWLYSTDGLTYTEASSKLVDATLDGTTQQWLTPKATAEFDWIHPNTETGLTPLGNGSALAGPDWPHNVWAIFDAKTMTWSGFRFGDGSQPEGRYLVDSGGRLHNVVPRTSSFEYRMSTNGGQTWRSVQVALPAGHTIEEWDFRVNRAARVAAVVIHAQKSTPRNDVDLVYKLAIGGTAPTLQRQYQLGLGNVDSTAGVGSTTRLDFQTIAIFNDGRVAVSVLDSTTKTLSATGAERNSPAVAIEGATTFPRGKG